MKRLLFVTLLTVLVFCLACNAFATGAGVAVSSAKGGPGQIVYLTVELQEAVEANAVGIQCQYDTSLLDAVPELSTWETKGLISAFEADNKGVWASQNTEAIEGKLCTLAFQIKDDAAFDTTEVVCTVVIKDGASEKVNATIKSVISCQCTHNYGPWESTGSANHMRTCDLCGGKNTQTHNWDSGIEETQSDGRVLLIKKCTVCGARDATEITTKEQGNTGLPGMGTDTESDHEHSSQLTNQTDHDHDDASADEHIHTETENDPATIWVVLLLPVVLIAAGMWYLKKK